MGLLQLTLMFLEHQKEDRKQLMPTMDQERSHILFMKELTTVTIIITLKILVKEILMKKFKVLLQLTLMFLEHKKEDRKQLMIIMDQERSHILFMNELIIIT